MLEPSNHVGHVRKILKHPLFFSPPCPIIGQQQQFKLEGLGTDPCNSQLKRLQPIPLN